MPAARTTLLQSSFDMSPASRRETKDKFDLQDYAVIEKVSQLVHAVGRVSDQKGSAILISLPDATAFNDYQQRREADHHRRSSTRSRRGPTRRHSPPSRVGRPTSTDIGAYFGDAGTTGHRAGADSVTATLAAQGTEEKMASHFALLLTTSQVFSDRKDAAGRTVSFLEQTVAGTAALLGRQPRPITVAVRSDCGFVSSLSEAAATFTTTTSTTGQGTHRPADTTRSASLLADGSTEFEAEEADAEGRDDADDDDGAEVVSIGYALTYCEVLPPAMPVDVDRGGESVMSAGGSYAPGFSFMGSSLPSGEAQEQSHLVVPFGWSRQQTTGARPASLIRRGFYPSGAAADMQSSCVSLGNYRKPSQEDLFLVKPLTMPLLAASIAPVRSGDVHLWVTHFLDGLRHYALRRVAEVSEDCCLYEEDKTDAAECSSGGVVFDANGDFVGIQHQENGEALCILTRSIVRHLFATNKLALCRSPIANGLPPGDTTNILDPTAEERDVCADTAGTTTAGYDSSSSAAASQERLGVHGSTSSGSLRAAPMQVADFQQLLDARVRRERQMPVTQRMPTTDEVFTAFYTDFQSLPRMLHAFSYCATLTQRILAEIARHEFRRYWSSLASSGTVGLTLEIIDGNADNEALVTTALSALAQLSIFDANLTVFVHVDGVPTVMEIMKEYIHAPTVLQWGAYCLVQATAPTAPFVADSLDAFTRSAGIELAVECLRLHGAHHRHLTLWVSTLIANTLQREPKYATVVIHEDLPPLLMQYISDFSEDFSVLEGLLRLLHTIVAPLAGVESAGARRSHRKPNFVVSSPAHADGGTFAAAGDAFLREVPSALAGSISMPLSDLQPVSSSSEASAIKSTASVPTVERNAFFVRRAFARQDRLVWNVLAHVCDAASRVCYSTRAVELMQLSLETLLVMLQWGFLPVRRVRNVLSSALERTELNYPTADTLLESFRRCHAGVESAMTEKELDRRDSESAPAQLVTTRAGTNPEGL